MTEADAKALRKIFTKTKFAGSKLTYMVVDPDQSILAYNRISFTNITEEEAGIYYQMFKKALSGKLNKNLYNIEVTDPGKEDGLYNFRADALNTDKTIKELYGKIVENYISETRYAIISCDINYDIPRKGTDNAYEDESEDVYQGILTIICPITLAKYAIGLTSETENVDMGELPRLWQTGMPVTGFLYPAMDGNGIDRHTAFAYVKKDVPAVLFDALFGASNLMTGDEQAIVLANLLTADGNELTDMESIQEVTRLLKERKENGDTDISKDDLKDVFTEAGVKGEVLEKFDDVYKTYAEDKPLAITSLPDKIKVETEDSKIEAKNDSVESIKHTVIDGREYILIPVAPGLEVNGVPATIK